MTLKSRYTNKYNAFVDGMEIYELADTNDFIAFAEICNEYGHLSNFYAYANNVKIDTAFLVYIDLDDDDEVNKAIELIDMMTL